MTTSPSEIPEAAVEAAARVMFAEEQCDRRQKLDVEANWRGRLDDRDRAEYRNLARAALEAAAPHMLREAWEAGFGKGSEFEGWSGAVDGYKPDFTNPYRSAE